jgi:hypothetical protein
VAALDRYGWVLLIVAVIALVIVIASAEASGRLAESYGEDPAYWRRVSLAFGFLGYLFVSAMLTRRHPRR